MWTIWFWPRSLKLLAGCWIGFLACAASGLAAQEVTKVVAAVNNEVITSKDIDDYCAALELRLSDENESFSCSDEKFRREALERLIEDKLVLAEAKKEAVDVPASLIDEQLSKVMLSYPSREAFEASLRKRGLTVTAMRNILKEKILMQAIVDYQVKSFITVSPQEISDFYMDNKDSFFAPQTYTFYIAQSDRYLPLKAIADAIDQSGVRLVQKQYNNVLFTVESSSRELLPELARAVERLKEGEQTIEEIGGRYYFIHLASINPPRLLSLEEAKEQIQEHLKDIKFKKRFGEWVESLKTTAVIKRYATP